MEIKRVVEVVERFRRTNVLNPCTGTRVKQTNAITRHTNTTITTKDDTGLHYHEKHTHTDILKYACQTVFPVRLVQLGARSL